MTAKKILLALFAAVTAATFVPSRAYASENTAPTQAYINEETLDLFVSDGFDGSMLDIKVANRETDIYDYGTISDKEIAVRTTVLIDVSTSVPAAAHDRIAEFLDLMIESLAKNEQMRILTFGAEINALRDFTADRYELDKAVRGIEYNETQSTVYNAVYNTIPTVEPIDGDPCFYRTIVVTDGADYAAQGITKEELFLKLQALTYPLDVICVSETLPTKQNKSLSALVRISGGRYFDIYPESDVSRLVSDISVGNYFWIRADIPAQLLDGSTRQVDILDGDKSLSFDMKMSIVDAPVESAPVMSSSSATSVPEQDKSSLSGDDDSSAADPSDDEEKNITVIMIIVIAGGVLTVLLIAFIITVLILKKKRSRPAPPPPTPVTQHAYDDAAFRTEFISDDRYAVKLSNVADPGECWVFDVTTDIIIGRADGCDVNINEKSVSREQCKIRVSDCGLVISELSSSNPTKLNGVKISEEALLHSSDTISCGRVALKVDYIRKLGEENQDSDDGDFTRSIFTRNRD